MSPYPPHSPQQLSKDKEHLDLLGIFHFVNAGLLGLYLIFLVGHYLLMTSMFSNPAMWEGNSSPPPKELMGYLRGFYVFSGLLIVGIVTLNILAGRFLRSCRNRTFLFVVAGLNCLNIPLGTVLGVFTIVVLVRPTVADRFLANASQ